MTTDATEAELTLGPAGLSIVSLAMRGSHLAWQFTHGHPVTNLTLDGERSGVRPWRVRSWEVAEEERAVRLIVTFEDGTVVLTESIWLAG
ncbi:MAG: hypothetical protein H0W59_08105, partial [Chloroflexia bacterium]|nr:hypothetical protein [Chloroflexia bacterium]